MNTHFIIMAIILAAFAACSSSPAPNAVLEQARADFRLIESSSTAASLAEDELKVAAAALRRAEAAWADKDSRTDVDHLAYLSIQHSAIARQTTAIRTAQLTTSGAAEARNQMLLQTRTDQAAAAQRELARAQQDSVRSNAQRDAAERARTEQALAESRQNIARSDAQRDSAQAQTARTQQALDESRQDTVRSDAATAAALAQAERSQQQAGRADIAAADANRRSDASAARVSSLEAQLSELNARPSPRGMIVTLGDVLFASGAAHIVPGVANNLEQLAAFMRSNPEQAASIEGYTDSVGNSSFNYALSQMRADAVRSRLIDLGVNEDRLTTRAFGPERPVASNDTETGRQMNRRVEIVFSQ
jgi:outer membrane protein OmpA-like peptidoglycan-associated protein